MSSFNWHGSQENVVIPWNAQYEFPGMGSKAYKLTTRVVPRNGSVFKQRDTIKIELPAQGYINPHNTTLAFDVYLRGYTGAGANSNIIIRMQNDISSIFKTAVLRYGSSELERINDFGYLARQLTEISTGPFELKNLRDKGIGMHYPTTLTDDGTDVPAGILRNARHHLHSRNIMALAQIFPNTTTVDGLATSVYRYQIHLPFGLFTQGKLIPAKWMASQLQIELTLAPYEESIFSVKAYPTSGSNLGTGGPSFELRNVVLIPEILEYDTSYDKQFLQGLKAGGIPLQLSCFNTFTSTITTNSVQMTIPEKARSVKCCLTFMREQTAVFNNDYGASLGDVKSTANEAVLEYYQYRVGGRYYPSSPVLNTTLPGVRMGSAEPLAELKKCLSCDIDTSKWNKTVNYTITELSTNTFGPQHSGCDDGLVGVNEVNANGFGTSFFIGHIQNGNSSSGSSLFCMAVCFENSNGKEINGLNVEEQSDIILTAKWSNKPTATPTNGVSTQLELVSFTSVDKIMFIKENNLVDLIE
jgi:hypothetical protein